jgi:hypothetical protein
MKKSLVMVMALIFLFSSTGPALLAAPNNSFADVPANSWAYGAVSKLAEAGLIIGYDDQSFRGNKMLTRYEMAQIVANAITKEDNANDENKALIEKLAAEFSTELHELGIRVSNVENKVDKLAATSSGLKFSGWDRLRYIYQGKGPSNPTFANRFDLMADTDPSNTIAFHFRDAVSNYTAMGTYPTGSSGAVSGNTAGTTSKTNQIADINITYKNVLPGLNVMAGRYSLNLSQTGYLAGSTGGFDGIEGLWNFGKNSLKFGYADASVINLLNFNGGASAFADVANIYYGEYKYQPNRKIKFDVDFVKSQTGNTNQTVGSTPSTSTWSPGKNLVSIVGAGVNWKLDSNWTLLGDYWQNSAAQAKIDNGGSTPVGYVARVAYKGNQLDAPGSWGASFEYQKFQPDTYDTSWTVSFLGPVSSADDPYHSAFKGYDFQYNATLQKNFVFTAVYAFKLKNSVTNANYMPNGGNDWARMQVTYYF